jgi:hypothetical protein
MVMAASSKSNTSSASIRTQVRDIDGLSIRYAESKPREVDALLLSPWPESLFAFDRVWDRLAKHAHLVAVSSTRATSHGRTRRTTTPGWSSTGGTEPRRTACERPADYQSRSGAGVTAPAALALNGPRDNRGYGMIIP